MKFPKLYVDASNVTGSWRELLDPFSLAAAFATESWGTQTVDEEKVNSFNDRMKLVAFRNAIGSQEREILNALGYVDRTT